MSGRPDRDPAPSRMQLFESALESLGSAGVPFALIRGEGPAAPGDLDILTARARRRDVDAALERAGFVLRAGPRPIWKRVYVGATICRDGRVEFATIDLHERLVQDGIIYADAAGVIARAGPGGIPSHEDLVTLLFFHTLLAGRRLEGARLERVLAEIAAPTFGRARAAGALARFGTGEILLAFLSDPEKVAASESRWRALASRARDRLLTSDVALRSGAALTSFVGLAWRSFRPLGITRRPAIVSLLGPDGAGKSTLLATLTARLARTPIRPAEAYMGCWGRHRLVRSLSALAPHEVGPLGAVKRLKRAGRRALFFALLALEMGFRYLALVRRGRAGLVLCDRYVEDLVLVNGRAPLSPGLLGRAFLALFPRPDLSIYLERDPEDAVGQKPQLTLEAYRAADRALRTTLEHRARAGSLAVVRVDAPPDELAERILRAYWRVLVGGLPAARPAAARDGAPTWQPAPAA